MRYRSLITAFAIFLATAISISATTPVELARDASSSNPAVAAEAVKNLRALGPAGIDALLAKYAEEIKIFSETGNPPVNWNRIGAAIDSVAMQRDAYSSGLFWQTDMSQARAESKRIGKPILSLRLLGNLNEEFSCANSRLFRAILYSNSDISKYLKENYVLHWQSVRPAPRVTIDFGDGRKIERTITGNSIHYVVDSNGVIIDALPGLYSPQAFLTFLKDAKGAFDLPAEKLVTRKGQYAAYRKKIYDRLVADRSRELTSAGIKLAEPKAPAGLIPTATEASVRAVSKMIVINEIAILDAINDDFSKYRDQLDLSGWRDLSSLHAADTKIDANGIAFIKRQVKNSVHPDQFGKMIKNIEQYAALDTTQNDYIFRPQIYSMLSENSNDSLTRVNDRIYDKVFLTPGSDEWLGLYSGDIYTALDGNGIIR